MEDVEFRKTQERRPKTEEDEERERRTRIFLKGLSEMGERIFGRFESQRGKEGNEMFKCGKKNWVKTLSKKKNKGLGKTCEVHQTTVIYRLKSTQISK
jgi:hypothetical protein